jgi:hypothetical protein
MKIAETIYTSIKSLATFGGKKIHRKIAEIS